MNIFLVRGLSCIRGFVLACACLLASCTTTGDRQPRGDASETNDYSGQLFLAEARFILTKEQIVTGELGSRRVKDFYASLIDDGLTDDEITAGQVIAIRGAIKSASLRALATAS